VKGPNLQAVVAFGENAQDAVSLWDGKGDLPVFDVPHPSSHDPCTLPILGGRPSKSFGGSFRPTPTAILRYLYFPVLKDSSFSRARS
jgi:hypothetical protein